MEAKVAVDLYASSGFVRPKVHFVTRLSVDACIKQRDLFEGVGIAAVGEAAVVWPGVDCRLTARSFQFGKVPVSDEWALPIRRSRLTVGEIESFGLAKFAVAARPVDLIYRKILPPAAFRPALSSSIFARSGCASARPALFPADRHQLKPVILVYEIAGVPLLAPVKIGRIVSTSTVLAKI